MPPPRKILGLFHLKWLILVHIQLYFNRNVRQFTAKTTTVTCIHILLAAEGGSIEPVEPAGLNYIENCLVKTIVIAVGVCEEMTIEISTNSTRFDGFFVVFSNPIVFFCFYACCVLVHTHRPDRPECWSYMTGHDNTSLQWPLLRSRSFPMFPPQLDTQTSHWH